MAYKIFGMNKWPTEKGFPSLKQIKMKERLHGSKTGRGECTEKCRTQREDALSLENEGDVDKNGAPRAWHGSARSCALLARPPPLVRGFAFCGFSYLRSTEV